MREYLHQVLGQMKPKYDELTAFLSALTCIVLTFSHSDFRQAYLEILTGGGAPNKAAFAFVVLGFIATLGFIASIIHVFTERKKTIIEKTCMGIFVMAANGFAGISAGIEILPSRWSLLALFPIWNIVMGVMLLYQIGLVRFEVTDWNASFLEVIVGTIALFIVFALLDFGLRLSWALTFSICMFYSSTIVLFATLVINLVRLRRSARII
jgi:hypothetical protein